MENATKPSPALMKLRDAASFLSLSPWQLRRMVRRGELSAVRINSRLLFEISELNRLIAAGRARAEILRQAQRETRSHAN